MKLIKMHATRNDFVVIDQRNGKDRVIDARKIADRKSGVGCDQVIILRDSKSCSCLMLIFNADGTQSAMCGNALRCVGDILMSEDKNLTNCSIELADNRIVKCFKNGGKIFTNIGKPSFKWNDIPLSHEMNTLDMSLGILPLYVIGSPVSVSIGNPHIVFFVNECKQEYIEELGTKYEKHPIFLNNSNVEIIHILSSSKANLKIWERGVGITESCGSGACAAFAAARIRGLADKSMEINVPGGKLEVAEDQTGDITLSGDVTYVFEGFLY